MEGNKYNIYIYIYNIDTQTLINYGNNEQKMKLIGDTKWTRDKYLPESLKCPYSSLYINKKCRYPQLTINLQQTRGNNRQIISCYEDLTCHSRCWESHKRKESCPQKLKFSNDNISKEKILITTKLTNIKDNTIAIVNIEGKIANKRSEGHTIEGNNIKLGSIYNILYIFKLHNEDTEVVHEVEREMQVVVDDDGGLSVSMLSGENTQFLYSFHGQEEQFHLALVSVIIISALWGVVFVVRGVSQRRGRYDMVDDPEDLELRRINVDANITNREDIMYMQDTTHAHGQETHTTEEFKAKDQLNRLNSTLGASKIAYQVILYRAIYINSIYFRM